MPSDVIDQFISSAESKWGQPSGLVLLLPHGFEGQGPEHSSARIERFLVLCAGNNMQIANCTTPAQYFHLLRRQMYGGADRRGVRKPLVVFTPKSLLRHAKAVSTVADLTSGGFREVLPDAPAIEPGQKSRGWSSVPEKSTTTCWPRAGSARRITWRWCASSSCIPSPRDANDALLRYPLTAEVVWAQEEPRNMGPWRFMQEQLQPLLAPTGRELRYVGRPESASPATGSGRRHQEEQAAITDEAMSERPLIESRRNPRSIARRINRRQEAHQDSGRRDPQSVHPARRERPNAVPTTPISTPCNVKIPRICARRAPMDISTAISRYFSIAIMSSVIGIFNAATSSIIFSAFISWRLRSIQVVVAYFGPVILDRLGGLRREVQIVQLDFYLIDDCPCPATRYLVTAAATCPFVPSSAHRRTG